MTNYYVKNPHIPQDPTRVLGNVLRCKNGMDAGLCGTHVLCRTCMLRAHIEEAYGSHEKFSDVEAHLSQYGADGQIYDLDVAVSVSGMPIQLGDEAYMLLFVNDISREKSIQRRLLNLEYNLKRKTCPKKDSDLCPVKEMERKQFVERNLSLDTEHEERHMLLIVSGEKENQTELYELLQDKYDVIASDNVEDAISLYLDKNVAAVILGSDLSSNDANMISEAVHCCQGSQPVLRILKANGRLAGKYDGVVEKPLTKEKICHALSIFEL